ncbi:MAG TPA: hypothetical protein PLF22_03795 [Pseudomonadales bacterium]|nr:hypothetical protein [Pseudomonadales bacterium]
MSRLKSIFESIDKYINYYISIFVEEKTTKALFQATVILAGCFLIGAKDQAAFLYQQDISAYESKYLIEEKNGKKNLSEIVCQDLTSGYAECNIAKHKVEVIESYEKAFSAVMHLIKILITTCSMGCILSFGLQPYACKLKNA